MSYGLKYVLPFNNDLDELYEVYFEYLDYIGDSSNLIGSINALIIRSIGGDTTKLYYVLGQECLINIAVGKNSVNGTITDDSQLTIFDLIAQYDNSIRITVYRNRDYTKSIFQGFVVVQNNSQPFLDPPFILSIRALDGLGLLKNVDMIDFNGNLFTGTLSVEDWLGNCLYKTGQTLNLRVYWPFYPAGVTTGPPLQQIFLNAQIWQKGELTTTTDPSVDVFALEVVDVYTALEYICRNFRARLFQQNGVWNFVSLYSFADPSGFSYNESTGVLTSGVYSMAQVDIQTGQNYDVNIGHDGQILPVDDDAILYLDLATKWVKLNYNYDQSQNKICNQNFKQGDPDPTHDGTISSTIEDPSLVPVVTFNYKAYLPFCWTIAGGTVISGGTTPFPETAQTAMCYIRDVQDIWGASENRYLMIGNAASANHARSSVFKIDINDVLEVSYDFRTNGNLGSSIDVPSMHILLNGIDGSKWGLGGISLVSGNKWYLLDSNYMIGGGSNYPPLVGHSYQSYEATNTWNNISVLRDINGALIKVPISGDVFIILEGGPTGASLEYWFKNINITIHPYLQGSYQALTGDYNFTTTGTAIKQTMTETVEISDSPKRYFKGALVQSNGNLIPPSFHRKGITESMRFTQLMERIMWNNVNRILQHIEGQFRGLMYFQSDLVTRQAGMLNRYIFTDHPVPTKKFILTSFEKDYGTGKGRHVFVEILNDVNDSGFADPGTANYTFNYIFQ